jgi:hypothetical protein
MMLLLLVAAVFLYNRVGLEGLGSGLPLPRWDSVS